MSDTHKKKTNKKISPFFVLKKLIFPRSGFRPATEKQTENSKPFTRLTVVFLLKLWFKKKKKNKKWNTHTKIIHSISPPFPPSPPPPPLALSGQMRRSDDFKNIMTMLQSQEKHPKKKKNDLLLDLKYKKLQQKY